MKSEKFQDGYLEYVSSNQDHAFVLDKVGSLEDWENGFLVFANREIKLSKTDFSLKEVINQRVTTMTAGSLTGAEGYLMEINLWRRNEEHWEEIVAERQGTQFFVQQWQLSKSNSAKASNCSFRPVDTWYALSRTKCPTLEVVCSRERLHFFITVEAKSLAKLEQNGAG